MAYRTATRVEFCSMSFPFARQRSRRGVVAALLLPALLFRAFVPAGFMLMMGSGGQITIELCPGAVTSPAGLHGGIHAHHTLHSGALAAGGVHSHAHSGDVPGSTTAAQDHVPCLFAASATPAPAPTVQPQAGVTIDRLRVASQTVAKFFSPSIVRSQSPRARPFPVTRDPFLRRHSG